ncbi:MAG: type II secretion system protein GspM [Gemmatimonadales bacterium]
MAGGAIASVLLLVTTSIVLPAVRRWDDREAAIAARRTQLGQLERLMGGETATRQTLTARRRDRSARLGRLLTGATPALAASDLQALLQGYADASRVTLDRVDLAADPGEVREGGLPAIPASVSGSGDIYGLADWLARLQYGGKLLVIDELRVNASPIGGTGPQLLTWSVRLHGAYSSE